jgi:hypothetical protein
MVTRAQFARLALALPETVQASHFGKPDFRVKGKIFAGLDPSEPRASLKMRKDLQALLVSSRPQAFVPATGGWGDSGWTMIELGHVALAELRELVTQAWALIAPARLVAQLAGAERGPGELDITPSVARSAASGRARRSATSPEPSPRSERKPRTAAKKAKKAKKRARASRVK